MKNTSILFLILISVSLILKAQLYLNTVAYLVTVQNGKEIKTGKIFIK